MLTHSVGTRGPTVSVYFAVRGACLLLPYALLRCKLSNLAHTFFVAVWHEAQQTRPRMCVCSCSKLHEIAFKGHSSPSIRNMSSYVGRTDQSSYTDGIFCRPCIGVILHRVMRMTRLKRKLASPAWLSWAHQHAATGNTSHFLATVNTSAGRRKMMMKNMRDDELDNFYSSAYITANTRHDMRNIHNILLCKP